MNECVVVQFAFAADNIKELVEKNMLTEDLEIEREKIIATDGTTVYMHDKVNEFDDDTFDLWMKYHLATCERLDLIGATNHSLDILKKI